MESLLITDVPRSAKTCKVRFLGHTGAVDGPDCERLRAGA